jgi:hypothetical protein
MVPALAALLALAAAPPRWVVVDVEAPDAMMGLAGQVTRAVLAEAQAQHLAVVTPEQLRASLPAKAHEALRHCGGNPACVAQALEGQGVARAVVGQLGRDEKNYLLKLWLIDVPGLEVVADVDRAILIAARRFQVDLAEAIPRLLRGEREARGTLVIESNLADAAVSVNGERAGVAPVSLALKPGKYEVKLERKKYLSVTRLIAVDANRETRERIPLLLKPGEVPDEVPGIPALAKRGEVPTAARGGFRLGAPTWIFGALTLLAAGATTYFGLSERALEQRLLDGYDPATQVYAGTRQDALTARQHALFTTIGFAVTGAALLVTVISLIVDVARPQVAMAPWLGLGGGGLALGGRF